MVSFCSAAVLLLAAATPAFASEKLITNYEPASEVTDHANIDRDQQLIEFQLNLGTDGSFSTAKDVYMNGAYSKSISTLTLASPLTSGISVNTQVTGSSPSGDVAGKIFSAASVGDSTIEVQYALSNSGCFVGANPAPVTDGCFNSQGAVTIVGTADTLSYTYVVEDATRNGRTIQGFSTSAQEKMQDWPTYQKFFKYYGVYDYANQWVLAAFNGGQTSFTDGNANFGSSALEGKEEAIKKGTSYMNVWMYVVHEMEDAIRDCNEDCNVGECNADPVLAWDEAVAFYSGSLEGTDGKGDGVLVYGLADKRCVDFNTCENGSSGTSKVNKEIIGKFADGKRLLTNTQCSEAKAVKEEIEKLMAVPLIQGTIRYAYIVGETGVTTEKAKAEGAVFAASVLPIVAACSETDADTIYTNMRVGASQTTYQDVKKAFENQYGCMGVTCEDVGGVWDASKSVYFEGTAPCNGGGGSSAATMGASVGLVVAAAIALML